jgi:hypothetical protein
MGFFRYVTPVLKGPWRRSREEALADALAAGQAYLRYGDVCPFEFTEVEERSPSASSNLRDQSVA